jgi:hypothetical protein
VSRRLELELLDPELMVVRLDPDRPTPDWAFEGEVALTAVVRTADELSVVAQRSLVPPELDAVGPWRALKVRGPLAFELTGIMADLAGALARAKVSLFAISTYDTDYILVREEATATAVATLRDAGHSVSP